MGGTFGIVVGLVIIPLLFIGFLLFVSACSSGFARAEQEKKLERMRQSRLRDAQLKLINSAQVVLDDLNKPVVVPTYVPGHWGSE